MHKHKIQLLERRTHATTSPTLQLGV